MKKKEEIKDFYNNFSRNLIKDKIYSNPRHEKIINYLTKIFKKYKFNTALEIGCGIGIISEFISKNVPEVTGIDISDENIKFAKATIKKVSFHSCDFLEFPVKQKYDLITLFDVLEHIPQETHLDVFSRIVEISKESTLIIITVPDPIYLLYIREHNPEKLQVVDQSIYLDEMVNIFKRFYLEVISFEKYGIDYNDQYNFYLLSYKNKQYKPTRVSYLDKNFLLNYLDKLINRFKRIPAKIRYEKYLK